MATDQHTEGLCGVCRKMDVGIAVKKNRALTWVCYDPECLELCQKMPTVPQQEFNRIEHNAALSGGDSAGAFLDRLGKTDLAALSSEEWADFCKTLVAGYRESVKAQVADMACPF